MTTTIRRVGHQDRECLRSTVGDHDCNQAASDEISVGARAQSICNDATRPNLIRRELVVSRVRDGRLTRVEMDRLRRALEARA